MAEEFNKATYMAAWANELVYMCDNHMTQLAKVGSAIGAPIQPRPCGEGHQCKNCLNEAKEAKDD